MALQVSEFHLSPTRRIAACLGLLTKPRASVRKQAVLTSKTAEITPTPSSAAANAGQRLASLSRDAKRVCASSPRVRAVWGSATMLTASLLLGIYIGVSGEAVLALCNTGMLASDNLGAATVFAGSAFDPGQFEGNDGLGAHDVVPDGSGVARNEAPP